MVPIVQNISYCIVHFKANWADEMDIYGYSIMPSSEWEEEKLLAKSFFKEVEEWEVSIGSNQSIYFHGYDNWVACFNSNEIPEHIALGILASLTKDKFYTFGKFITPNRDAEDIEFYKKIREDEAEKKRRKNNPTQDEVDKDYRDWLEELKSMPVETDRDKKYLNHMRMNNLLSLKNRTECQDQIIAEYRRILKGYLVES